VTLDTGSSSEIVSWCDSDGHDDEIGFETFSIGKLEPLEDLHRWVLGIGLGDHGFDVDVGEALDAHVFDSAEDHRTGFLVELSGQGVALSVDDTDVGNGRQVVYRFGSFKTEQTSSDDRGTGDLGRFGVGDDLFEVG
jgi:hypothetical protein